MKNTQVSLLIVFLVAFVSCVANIWEYPITILDEAKNAEAAREMWEGNSFLPTFNGALRTDKPPLHYFFMQLGFDLFGPNVFGARFFGALMGSGLITYFYVFLRRFSTINIARIATFILVSSFFWVQEFHLAVPDPYLLGFLCTAWMLFFSFFITRKSKYIWLFYVFVGLATLAKGPVAIGLSGLIVLVFLIMKKEFSVKEIMNYRPILGGFLVLLIAVPWFLWVHIQTDGAFSEGFFLKHNIQRFSNEMEGHGGLFLITWGFVLLGLFPLGLFIPQGLWYGFKFRKRNDLTLFSLIVGVVIIVFFSISSTKLPNYTLPAMPFLSILIAGYFDEVLQFNSLKWWYNTVSLVLISMVTVAIPIAVYILFNHNLIMHLQVIYTIIFSVIVLVGLYFIWNFYLKENVQNFILSIGISWMVIGCLIFYLVYPDLAQTEPVIQAKNLVQNNQAVVYKSYDPAFNFNYGKVFPSFEDDKLLLAYLQEHPEVLVITKDRAIKDSEVIYDNFDILLDEPSVFENYRTIVLKLKD